MMTKSMRIMQLLNGSMTASPEEGNELTKIGRSGVADLPTQSVWPKTTQSLQKMCYGATPGCSFNIDLLYPEPLVEDAKKEATFLYMNNSAPLKGQYTRK